MPSGISTRHNSAWKNIPVCPSNEAVRERRLNRSWIYEWFKKFSEHPNAWCSKCNYTTWWIVSQSLKFKVLYQYGWREEREESNLLKYIPVAQPKKFMFKVNKYISHVLNLFNIIKASRYRWGHSAPCLKLLPLFIRGKLATSKIDCRDKI